MNFLKKLYIYNFWGIVILLVVVLTFSDRPMEKEDWMDALVALFIPIAAPIGYFFLKIFPEGMSWSFKETKSDVQEIQKDLKNLPKRSASKIEPASNVESSSVASVEGKQKPSSKKKKISKSGLFGIVLGALALSKANKAVNAPQVWFEGDSQGGDAQVLGVRPKGKNWEVRLRIKQSHMPSYSERSHVINRSASGFNLGSMKFGVSWT